MARYAIILGGKVQNVTEWDGITPWEPPSGTQAIPCPDNVAIGWTYDGAAFSAPTPPAPVYEPIRISKIDFFRLFTTPENAAFNRVRKDAAALTSADYSNPAKAALVGFEVFLNFFDATDTIELNHPDTVQGVTLLAALGVITPDRVPIVLAGTKP